MSKIIEKLFSKFSDTKVFHNNEIPDWIKVPSAYVRKEHIIKQLKIYWPTEKEQNFVRDLPIKKQNLANINLIPELIPIKMPNWVNGITKENYFYIPKEAIRNEKKESLHWQNIDWWLVAFLLLESTHERLWEYKYGPIHSYRWKLKNWNDIMWDYAWVNRIGIFLRKWALADDFEENVTYKMSENIRISHDLDAIKLTKQIILKQLGLKIFQSLKYLVKRKFKKSLMIICSIFKILRHANEYDNIKKVITKEDNLFIKPIINIHSRSKNRGPLKWLLDPSYSLNDQEILNLLKILRKKGWEIGLHPSYFSFNSSKEILREKLRLKKILKFNVKSIRQHWLRFSWKETWLAQNKAGLDNDYTLMFNDKAGFRNSAALTFTSFYLKNTNHKINSSSFMDAHKRENSLFDKILDEVSLVKGSTCFLWHTHTLGKGFGWEKDWEECILKLKQN